MSCWVSPELGGKRQGRAQYPRAWRGDLEGVEGRCRDGVSVLSVRDMMPQ